MLLLGDSAVLLKDFNSEIIDLTVTSPPYDNLRSYQGNSQFDFETIAQELFRVTKQGGVVVWVVGDKTVNGDETGTSFRQALYFKEIGFKLNDTMILQSTGFSVPSCKQAGRYHQVFQYVFVFSKGKPKTFNPIIDRQNKTAGSIYHRKRRNKKDEIQKEKPIIKTTDYGMRFNVWVLATGSTHTTKDHIFKHPAVMPEPLARDLIISWSNEDDLILDPFMGSGTTCKMAKLLNRKYIGIDINPEYLELAQNRIKPLLDQTKLI